MFVSEELIRQAEYSHVLEAQLLIPLKTASLPTLSSTLQLRHRLCRARWEGPVLDTQWADQSVYCWMGG